VATKGFTLGGADAQKLKTTVKMKCSLCQRLGGDVLTFATVSFAFTGAGMDR
jgi:hypothetical protein